MRTRLKDLTAQTEWDNEATRRRMANRSEKLGRFYDSNWQEGTISD